MPPLGNELLLEAVLGASGGGVVSVRREVMVVGGVGAGVDGFGAGAGADVCGVAVLGAEEVTLGGV